MASLEGDYRPELARQEPLDLSLPQSVAIVGVGGVGSWIAYFLALAGVQELWLFDHDTIEIHNTNRLPVPFGQLGRGKSEVMAEVIKRERPSCVVYPCGRFIPSLIPDLQMDVSWIVAATDSVASRKEVEGWAAANYTVYIEAAAEGEIGSVTGQSAGWSTPEEEQAGYRSVPVWVGPCVLAAAVTVAHIVHGIAAGENNYRLGWDVDKLRFDVQIYLPREVAEPEHADPLTSGGVMQQAVPGPALPAIPSHSALAPSNYHYCPRCRTVYSCDTLNCRVAAVMVCNTCVPGEPHSQHFYNQAT